MTPSDSDLRRRNLAALDPGTAAEIERAGLSETARVFCCTESRSGPIVTGERIDGRDRYFHSVYDPAREATRLADQAGDDAAIVLGFGSGLHLRPLLDRCARVIVIEPDLSSVHHALGCMDLSGELSDESLYLLVGEDAKDVGTTLPAVYLPAIDGSARVIELPGRVQAVPALFRPLREQLRAALEAISDDFATQARLGNGWLRNTLLNLSRLATATATAPAASAPQIHYPRVRDRDVVVTAAGPSLSSALLDLREGKTRFVLATDTSLPTLLGAGVNPDAVFTVDCQFTSYMHYLTAGFPDVPVIADISAPTAALRGVSRLAPLLSRHPLHDLLARIGLRLPSYDSSGGNVTHAAVAYCLSRGARSVAVLGADYSYPLAESYARSSYVHRHFTLQSCRLRPLSAGLYDFAVNRPGVYRDPAEPSTLRIPSMDHYEAALKRLMSESGVAGGGHGEDAVGEDAVHIPPDILGRLHRIYAEGQDVRKSWLFGKARSAPASGYPGHDGLVGEASFALVPLAAWFRRQHPEWTAEQALEAAERTTRETIERLLADQTHAAGWE